MPIAGETAFNVPSIFNCGFAKTLVPSTSHVILEGWFDPNVPNGKIEFRALTIALLPPLLDI